MGEFVRLEVEDGVGTIRIDRPKMNALNVAVQEEIRACAAEAGTRDDVRAVIVYGGEKVFAAGADVKEMADMTYTDMVERSGGLQSAFTAVAKIPKPVVAAVTGYALGGGCELALCADVRIAGEGATLGQPEILLGIIPGAGGTQRLARFIGKAKAMDLILTGRMMDAAEAERSGLVARVVPAASLMEEAIKVAETIAALSQPSLLAAKEAVNRSFETSLAEGVRFERRVFHALFATKDRKEGMTAFIEKRPPRFTND